MSVSGDSASLHGAYVARQCPVRLFRERDPFETAESAEPDAALQTLFDEGIAFETAVVERLAEIHGDGLVCIAPRDTDSPEARVDATMAALRDGVRFIAGALLEHDTAGRRLSEVDLLMRVPSDPDDSATPRYWPIDIKHHRATKVTDKPIPDGPPHLVVDLDLSPIGAGLIPQRTEADCLQLAHYQRHLEALGYAAPPDVEGRVWGGVIGSRGLLVWFDLAAPAHATTTPQIVDDAMEFHKRTGKNRRSALERYDFEFSFRLDIADSADARTSATEPPPVAPIKIKECDRCAWKEPCHADLVESDDVSLVNGVGYPEWSLHRHLGNGTTEALAALDTGTARALASHGTSLVDAHAWAQHVDPATPTAGTNATSAEPTGDSIDPAVAADFPTARHLQQLCERTLTTTHRSRRRRCSSRSRTLGPSATVGRSSGRRSTSHVATSRSTSTSNARSTPPRSTSGARCSPMTSTTGPNRPARTSRSHRSIR